MGRVAAVLAIQADSVVKVYGGRLFGFGSMRALSEVDLRLPRGQALGVIGLNGSGKTTLVKSVLGVVQLTSGSIRVLGGQPSDAAIRARIGYLPERLALPPAWTALGFLKSVGRLKGVANPRREALRQLERVELAPRPRLRIRHFSKGMRQRLGLAAALVGAPDLLVLDEPSDGIDSVGRRTVRNLLSAERDRGTAILLNSHLLSETERMCDRIAILYQGRIAKSGSVAELCGSEGAYRVRFERAPSDQLRRVGFFPHADGGYRTSASTTEELNGKLQAALEAGALLRELRPDTRPLEEVLAEVIAE